MIISLDGQSGTGKSTLAKIVAEKLGFNYLNSGMLYRALTYYFITNNVLPDNYKLINSLLENMVIEVSFKNGQQYVKINKNDLSPFISCREVQQNVSFYSQILEIRKKITDFQRKFAISNNIVVEGRDVGTNVFHNADYKFFIVCDIIVRAKRRLADLQKMGQSISFDEVLNSLKKRDYLDMTRKYSPLKKADNAIVIDTSNSTINESVNLILSYINNRS